MPTKQYIIIDTCVIQFAGKSQKHKSEAVITCLSDLTQEGYKLAITNFTVFENLHGLWGKKAEEASALLDIFEIKEISTEILIFASFLGGLYCEEKYEYIQAGDKIIAATAIMEKALVLTNNHRDFPPPFFLTEKSISLEYKKNHYTEHLDLALYKPDEKLISRRISQKSNNLPT